MCGLFPAMVYLPPPRTNYYDMTIFGHWGYLFTWLPVNPVHNIVYILIGGGALVMSAFRESAILYARALFFLMVIFTITGFLPFGAAELWGVMPLFDWNVMLHSVTAMLLFYYGFIYPLDWGGKEPAAQMRSLGKTQ
jgi:hypothetical protein